MIYARIIVSDDGKKFHVDARSNDPADVERIAALMRLMTAGRKAFVRVPPRLFGDGAGARFTVCDEPGETITRDQSEAVVEVTGFGLAPADPELEK